MARISGRVDILSDEETSVSAVGSAAVVEIVRDWLVEFERVGESHERGE